MFTGCQDTHDSKKGTGVILNQDKRMGTIQSLGGAHVSSQATHLLRLDDGKTLYLKSSVIDLANIKYIAKIVEVAGNILRTTDGNEVMDVMNIDIIDRDTNVAQNAPQWMDYGSDNLHIGLKYRDDYKLQENSSSLALTKTVKDSLNSTDKTSINLTASDSIMKQAIIEIQVISKDENYNLLETMGVTSDSSTDLLSKGYSKSKITQKALDAYKQAKSDGSEINYYIKSGYSYHLKFSAGDSATLVTDQNMFYDVLASINFGSNLGNTKNSSTNSTEVVTSGNVTSLVAKTNESSIEGFQNFSSEAMKFSIQYPKGYYFGNTASQTPSAVRSYAFSSKPADDASAELLVLDIIKGSLPSGTKVDLGNGKQGVIAESGNSFKISVDWSNGQFFQIGGPSNLKTVMQQMASTIKF